VFGHTKLVLVVLQGCHTQVIAKDLSGTHYNVMGTLNDGICVSAKSCNIQFPAGEYRENNYLWLCCNMSASFCIWVDCLRLTFSMSTC